MFNKKNAIVKNSRTKRDIVYSFFGKTDFFGKSVAKVKGKYSLIDSSDYKLLQ